MATKILVELKIETMIKSFLFITTLFVFHFSFSQNANTYEINTKINVETIQLKIDRSLFKENKEILKEVVLYRENDSISYLTRIYGYDEEDEIEFPTAKFDEIAYDLKQLNIDEINDSLDRNIQDGNHYELTFSDDSYKVIVYTNTPRSNTQKRGLGDYLKLCSKIWNLGK